MNVSIFGLGYVGSVSAACLANDGHHVVGVDINEAKLSTIRGGRSPVVEPGVDELIATAVEAGSLTVTDHAATAVAQTDISLVCVGTPGKANGSLDAAALIEVCRQIGAALATSDEYHVVVVRSSVLPGTVRGLVLPAIEDASGRTAGEGFGLVVNPEFLREASALEDFYEPSFTLIGSYDDRSGKMAEEIYSGVDAPVIRTDIETAELVKYANNSFHATKVTFANEVGTVAKAHGIDGREVMDILCMDTRLNVSPAYLRPGFAFGGSCLPKDTRALVYRSKELDLDTPLLDAVLVSNDLHLRRAISMVEVTGMKRVAVLGLSFKPGTDDVRESPSVPLIETLVGRGYDVTVYDEHVHPDRLVGANRAFLEREIPHITALMAPTVDSAVADAEVIVIATGAREFRDIPATAADDQVVIDLVGVLQADSMREHDDGICW